MHSHERLLVANVLEAVTCKIKHLQKCFIAVDFPRLKFAKNVLRILCNIFANVLA